MGYVNLFFPVPTPKDKPVFLASFKEIFALEKKALDLGWFLNKIKSEFQ